MGKTLAELHAMLKLHEKGIPKKAETPAVLAIREGKIQKDKKKNRKGQKEVGHWRRNYQSYHAELKKRKNVSMGLRESRKLKHGALSMCKGNGMRAAVEAIRSFDLNIILVENQLGKKIKAIRSDRGGEYPSHKFVNHMKSCGIVSQLTPPYTPQHNEVSERRNRTLLDMIRSMMNLTTLSKSFWGYALETTTRILNMVSTKKVDRKPYEIWHGKAPKLSYLRVWGCYPKEMIEASESHRLLKMSGSDKGIEIIQEEDTQPSKNTSEEHNKVTPIEEYELGDLDEPPNYKAALADPESDKWLKAMNTKMQSMKDNQVWYLVDLPSNGRTVRCKWLFKKKTDMDDYVHTFKARLVAKGFTQTYGVDYRETFSPVADIRTIRILLAITAFYDYEFWFDEEIKKIGFSQNPDDPCVYLKASGSNVSFLVLYVDDMLLMGNSVTMLKEVKSWLCRCFSMKDLGEATYILGIKIIRDRSKWLIALSQSAYLEKILKKFIMENSKKGYAPMMEKHDYRKPQGAKTPTEQNPGEIHWTAVKTILKYLRNTKDMVLVYGAKPEDELKVSCYADASFQTNKDDTKSQTGYVFVLNGGAVNWKCSKQSTTAMSSTEAEYIAPAEASIEAI
ncbi:retrotransposon protein, putative, ty1-copia subclass [Tanacetum coccineum]